jgi:deoxycytidylate deaminase
MHKYLDMALQFAKDHEYHDTLTYNLCAIIVSGGRVMSIGYNKRSTNAFVEHYADKARGRGRDFCLSMHAEQEAVLLARQKTDLTGSKIFVARVRREKTMDPVGMARPCVICENMLRAYGIKRAYYTIDTNHYGIMHLGTIKSGNDKIIRTDI